MSDESKTVERRQCTRCGVKHLLDQFQKKKNGEFRKLCNDCGDYYREYRRKHNAKITAREKQYRHDNAQSIAAYKKEHYANNRTQIRAEQKEYRDANRELINQQKREFHRRQFDTNPEYRIANNLRKRMYKVIKFGHKSAHTMELLGCTIEEFSAHIEKQFTEGMNWQNYGKGWHLDHIRPCASFNLLNAEDQRICFHWSNYQPLWALENMSKNDTWQAKEDFDAVMSELVSQ